ncbi:hypothetical protein QA649_01590 [Bradyrhizobium sp. CB1717]|uniref:hypothetical protein n=1 Tax=Bradyrhizobium sp. CB1717 TaxID=3039154 RepID=UPI0024B1A938|nr:hypothetical protein [Bradyrhizobium sp. CB1717]WFU24969.1 hypothetical protein QA649_01590 [Bradyrhizobium sp. CB1717]
MAWAFQSVLVTKPIPIDSAETEKALIHLTLDRNVTAIDHFDQIQTGDTIIKADAIFVRDHRGRHLLDIESKRPSEQVAEVAKEFLIPLWTISTASLLEEPRSGNESEVWSHRDHAVPVHLRMQIVAELGRKRALGMSELKAAIIGFKSIRRSILALACARVVQIDLEAAPLGPGSIVRKGHW